MPKKPLTENSLFVSRIHAAEMLDCSVQFIDKLTRAKRLRAYRFGRKVIFRREDLLRLVEER